MGKDNHILAKPISQSQASLSPKGNISIPLLMEQISNQNMYPKIIEAMQCQQIMLPSAFLMLGMSPAHRMTENVGSADTSDHTEDTSVLLPFGCSSQRWRTASKLEEAHLKPCQGGMTDRGPGQDLHFGTGISVFLYKLTEHL